MLITTAQINANAFLTPLDDSFFKSNIMYSVQEKDLRSIMGDALLDAVIADTASFPILHETYIIPFLAYQIKYYTLRLISSDLTIDTAFTNLVAAISETNLIARQNKTLLQDFIYTTYGVLPNSINGFTIPQSIIISNENTNTMPQSDIDDIPPSMFSASQGQTTFNLPQLIKQSSLIFINDSFINPTNYTGIGTAILTFTNPLSEYDKVVITF